MNKGDPKFFINKQGAWEPRIEYVSRWAVEPPRYLKGDPLWREKRLHVEIMGVEGDGVFQECVFCHHSIPKHEIIPFEGRVFINKITGIRKVLRRKICIMEKEEGYPYDLCACVIFNKECALMILGVEL